ncbi:hypothetical protein M3Y97_00864200 [Aphelenchoides bicaudatus]|nr:hypothetical protein M3Y97_00864200 [Aphelenchoides bicaudatus]
MSLIMTQTEHYPLNNHENSPTQSAIGYINNFPPANQWQQMNNSPNSMQNGSPMNPAMLPNSSINMPAAPSPLLNSMSNNSMLSNQQNMGMAGTPQQPGSVKTPLSVQQQQSNAGSLMLRNPFEEDLESRPASRQQMPPPTSNNQRLYFDMIKEFKAQLYCLNNDPMIRFRLPMAYNTKGTDQLKYPTTNINRSLSVVQKPALPTPQMPPMQMPVTSSAPSQPATKRRTTKKQKEQQQQEQLQSPQLNGNVISTRHLSHGFGNESALFFTRPFKL